MAPEVPTRYAIDSGPPLLPNGAFEEWLSAQPAPPGFVAPADPAVTRVRRDVRSGRLDTPGYTARQTWFRSDLMAPPPDRFHAAVTLDPETWYRLSAVAEADDGVIASLGVWEGDGAGGWRVIARDVVRVRGSEPARYEGEFQTVAGGRVLIASQVHPDSRLPGDVVWSAWALERAADPGIPATVADQPVRRGLLAATLDQVRAQLALYGGETEWLRGVAPVQRNVARVLGEAESRAGTSVLGYNGYVFRKEELAQYAETERLTQEASGAVRPAYAALVRAERSLAARGVHFVVMPVPGRMPLYADELFKPAADAPVNLRAHALLVERLLADDVFVIDVAPELWRMRMAGEAPFWRANTDLPSATALAMAAWSAPALAALLPPPGSGRGYTVETHRLPLEQPLVEEILPSQRELVAPEENTIHTVRDAAGALHALTPDGALYVLGSYGLAHQVRGASVAAHLGRLLDCAVAGPPRNVSDDAAPRFLREEARLDGVSVVLFCFPEAAMLEAGWE
ncbi:MAG: hypothetical protein KF886_18775 [Candidatus Hydrogenedentes bacterium]|nr:hypothetical protein [Candidatus Hydrogenedentota bacterium]